MQTATKMGETEEFKMTRKTGSAYRITCPNDYPIEHEMGPCTVVAVTDTKVLVSFGAGCTGYDVVHRYEAAVSGLVRKKFDTSLRPLLLPPPTVAGEPRASFNLLPDTLVFHESPDDVRDIRCVEPGATVRVIVQFIGIRRSDGGWEFDTAVTQVYIPPKKKEAVEAAEAAEAVEADRREEDRKEDKKEAVEADKKEQDKKEQDKKEAVAKETEEDNGKDKATQCASDEERREEERREEERAAETREMNEMLTTEVEQDVESFMI
jgi:hypothetical protein